ncbi:c-type cytochrome biogenesis protein CcmI [Saccharophagus degradans]|uniref:Tetratricopeptide TPR_2 n=1 Tax=Saccharophagus degradans (strain 2-40 / ATCC 43961 / DSM 17024) TaxID=203122 RepID=Q21JJ1_SACD2|nr:c-type cytochrome biogenesis protein CcmI [Saccharophagus degradans]ABD81138.1 Tetratricopeptide TPR_2 [Saccharophagus degradans 2-40]MBU2985552.1 c-type cytochrome biogenesis protein CcmI [Saccharophagus degradans]WGO96616.1 c-type cytochrome biogenesis protein CcmI [Saccharophagus degradans]
MAFWQVFLLFSALAAVFILWPAIRNQVSRKSQLATGQQDAINESVFEDHLADVDASEQRGELEAKEAESLKRDLENTLIMENKVDPLQEQPLVTNWRSRLPVISLVVAVPVLAIAIYAKQGAMADWEIYEQMGAAQNQSSKEEADKLYQSLLQRTAEAPENTQSWYLLATLAVRKGEYEEAVRAFKKVLQQQPEAAHVMAELANALFLQAGNSITPAVRDYTEQALALEPRNSDALGLAGIAAYQEGEFQKAIDYWQLALGTFHPDSPSTEAISQAIAQAQLALELSPKAEKSSKASDAKPAKSLTKVAMQVSLGKSVEVDPSWTVFIYARAWQGPRMPLAIQKVTVDQLPIKVELTEEMSMAQGMTLSSFSQVELVARVSQAGSAVPQSGDWEATFGPITPAEQKEPAVLVISEQIP